MKIAVIGSGISGLSSAYYLSKKFKVDLYEKENYFGGHSYTYNIKKNKISEEQVFEAAINLGAKDCIQIDGFYEIITEKGDFYKIKNELEKKSYDISYSAIEWRALNYIKLNVEQSKKMIIVLNSLEELGDVQNVFINANLYN